MSTFQEDAAFIEGICVACFFMGIFVLGYMIGRAHAHTLEGKKPKS